METPPTTTLVVRVEAAEMDEMQKKSSMSELGAFLGFGLLSFWQAHKAGLH